MAKSNSHVPEELDGSVNQLLKAVIEAVEEEKQTTETKKRKITHQLSPSNSQSVNQPNAKQETKLKSPSPKEPRSPGSDSDGKSRVRNEWTPEEDRIFLQGLRDNNLDFNAIARLLPNRTRSQIRTHYRYLAKSLKCNQEGTGPQRRIKKRGRPPRSGVVTPPSDLILEIQDCIQRIENSDESKSVGRGRPPSYKYNEISAFTKHSFSLTSKPKQTLPKNVTLPPIARKLVMEDLSNRDAARTLALLIESQ